MSIRAIAKWSLWIVGSVVGLVVLVGAAGFGYSEFRMSKTFTVPDHPITVRTDSATLALGHRLVTVRGCIECHGQNFGGKVMIDDPAVGRLVSANLTRGGRGRMLTSRDWERAIRHGVRADGTSLMVMPSQEFTTLADDDLAAMVAYIESLPAVTAELPKSRLGPVIRALYAAGQVDLFPAAKINHTRPHAAHIEPEPTPKYGEYLATSCTGCHGPGFSGGKIPGAPPDWKPAANITSAGIGHYKEADFIRVLREGKRPDGSAIDSQMPWKLLKEMNDTELKALYSYLLTVPPRPYGMR